MASTPPPTTNGGRQIRELNADDSIYYPWLWNDLKKQLKPMPNGCAGIAFQVFITLCELGRVWILQEYL